MSRRFMTIIVAAFAVTLVASSATQAEDWGTFSGQFVYGGDPPAAAAITVTKDTEVCSNHNLVDESLVVNADDKGIANIVIYMYLSSRDPQPAVHESYASDAEAKVKVDNKNCRFDPRVTTMRTSQTLLIGNSDPIGHNTKGECLANPAFNPIIPASGEIELKLPESERLPVSLSCSIHPWMNGYLLVKENPYFAVTDENGKFEIKNVPAGEWVFQVWHEKAGYIDAVVVDGAKTKWKKGRVSVKINADGKALGSVTVPAANFED